MKILKASTFLIISMLVFISCKEDVLPKPKAYLRLEYLKTNYELTDLACPYSFEISTEAIVKTNEKCWMDIEYPKLKASVKLTYRPVENNLKELFLEAEKLTFNHAIKADGISSVPYSNKANKVYGSIFEVTGNAASPIQFHVTDSSNNFITGAVYFNIKPNYDSIKPAINHLQKDIIHIIESLTWNE
ncbi:MAG: gliding motility lipoprotein GldD [Flavobacteriaceae bacterium]|nr:gliding motility lipoprotein GldD [Flavobacteriaceae bacterium]